MSQNQPDLSNDRANEGLPEQDFYKPEAVGNAAIEAGDPTHSFDEYGLEVVPVMHEGADTGRRFIRYNGNFMAAVSDQYQPLPNERAVEVANDVARDLDAVPFHHWEREDGSNDGWFVKLDDHVFQDPERRRVHALYALEEGTIGGPGDDMEYGFAVHNSIDTSMSFSVSLFSFRHACQNLVFIGTGSWRDTFAQNVEEERDVLESWERKHTSGFDVSEEHLEARMKAVATVIPDVHNAYQKWAMEKLTPDDVLGIIDRLPKKDLPEWAQDARDAIREAEKEAAEADGADDDAGEYLTDTEKKSIVADHIPTENSQWDFYNDLTESLWHDDGTGDTTKHGKMKKVHQVYDPLA